MASKKEDSSGVKQKNGYCSHCNCFFHKENGHQNHSCSECFVKLTREGRLALQDDRCVGPNDKDFINKLEKRLGLI